MNIDLDLVPPHAFRERLANLRLDSLALTKEASGMEHSISISRRKNALLEKDVQELKRRKEEQAAILHREENKMFALAREVAESEEKVNQMETELENLIKIRLKLENEAEIRKESIKEYDLILGLYEGCMGYMLH